MLNQKLRTLDTWVSRFNNTVKFIGTLSAAVVGATLWLAHQGVAWVIPVGTGAFGLLAGCLAGITIHRRYASKRNAPLGYRIELTRHEYSLDAANPCLFHRSFTRKITAKRDALYVIDGRMRTDADEVKLISSKHQQVIETGSLDGYAHYLVVLESELMRGDSVDVEIKHDFVYTSTVCEPLYIHRTAYWSNVLEFRVAIPLRYIEPGTLQFCERRWGGRGLGGIARSDFKFDTTAGIATKSIENPRLNRRYGFVWRWSPEYLDDFDKYCYNRVKEASMITTGVESE